MEIIAYRCVWDSGWKQYHDKTDPLPKKWDKPPDETAALVMKFDADAEIARLRAALDKIAPPASVDCDAIRGVIDALRGAESDLYLHGDELAEQLTAALPENAK